ncbi:HlyD family secretion protein [Paenibacillus sanguinis]|uniref:HlyD family secretion protein n=1 Tax=Paenibacillus sanguinis TaxID=225906 RepID=UPI000372365D|nr:HlyD family secretion protein [Paenibacillus sanguinis]
MNKLKKFVEPKVLVYVAIALLIVSGIWILNSNRITSGSEKASRPTATIEADQLSASFKVGGRIIEMLVEEGDEVTKGQVLARIESDEVKAKVAQAEAALAVTEGQIEQAAASVTAAKVKEQQGQEAASLTAETINHQVEQARAVVKAAQAKVDSLKTGVRQQELKQLEIQMQAAKEAYDIATKALTRTTELFNEGIVSQADLDKVKATSIQAKATYDAAVEQHDMAKKGARQEEIDAAVAQLEQAKAALALAEANQAQVEIKHQDVQAAGALVEQAEATQRTAKSGQYQAAAALEEATTYLGYTKLYAAVDGVVLSQSAELGEIVGSGFPVFTIQQTDSARTAKFYLPETEISGLKKGDTVQVKLVADGTMYKAKVITLAQAATFASQKATQNGGDVDIRSFGIKVELIDLPNDTPTGMTLEWYGKDSGAMQADKAGEASE